MSKVHYEAQVSQGGGSYWLTVTISHGENYWTSNPAKLHAATYEAATEEAVRQMLALRSVLEEV